MKTPAQGWIHEKEKEMTHGVNTTLAMQLEQVDSELSHLASTRKQIVAQIIAEKSADIENILKAKTEPFGTVTLGDFKFEVPKKVEWDVGKLAELAADIRANGEKAEEYIKISYEISEAKFKAWPDAIKQAFVPARTVSRGNVAVKLNKKEG